jgi:hypothetical protein
MPRPRWSSERWLQWIGDELTTDITGSPSPDSSMGPEDRPFRRSLYLSWPSSMPIRWCSDIILALQPLPTNQARVPSWASCGEGERVE